MRLIDAEKLKELAREKIVVQGTLGETFLGMFGCLVEMSPTVDASPVVRCKDCKFCFMAENALKNGNIWCRKFRDEFDKDGFCSEGKGKTN